MSRSSRSSTARARPPSVRARRRWCWSCWRARRAPSWRWAGAPSSPRPCARRWARTPSSSSRSTPVDAWRRASGGGRPLARDQSRFEQLQRDRQPLYAGVADAVLPPGGRDAIRSALPALVALAEAPPGTKLVWAGSASGAYPVFFGHGLIASGFSYPRDGRRYVVTDSNVARHHSVDGEERIAVEPGEERKTLAAAEEVLRWLARSGAERGDLVVAVGGGVVGDLAGFCAAVYQRGIRHVQVPTTLVAQVDSAYGGKTGVDLPEGKNYAGAYHQPAAVLCDPAALATLDAAELAAGLRGGGEDRPDRGRIAVGAGAPGRRGRPRDRDRLRAHEAGRGGRGRARRRAQAGAQPGSHGRPRDRVGHPLRPLPPRRGRGHRPARGPAALGSRGPARRGGRAARRARPSTELRAARAWTT